MNKCIKYHELFSGMNNILTQTFQDLFYLFSLNLIIKYFHSNSIKSLKDKKKLFLAITDNFINIRFIKL